MRSGSSPMARVNWAYSTSLVTNSESPSTPTSKKSLRVRKMRLYSSTIRCSKPGSCR